jgi:hypothetical protein
MTVSGVAAAAVLSVAVPVGLALDDRVTRVPDPGPAASGPTSPTPSSDPTAPRDGVLTNRVEARSGTPGIPYLLDGSLRTPEGARVPVEGDYDEVAALGDGWLATDFATGTVAFLDAGGDATGTDPATGDLAVSADGTTVVYARPDGTLMTAVADDSGGGSPRVRPFGDAGSAANGVRPVAVTGSGPCDTGSGCVVFFDGEQDGSPHGFSVDSDGTVAAVGNLRSVGGVSPEGAVAGLYSVADDGSCSAMRDAGGRELWSTCNHGLGQFSPDGRYVVGRPAYLDGIGDPSVAILDAGTGDVVAEWSSTQATQAFINNAAWDTDGTLLATVFEKDSWSLMRMSPDGSLTTVLPDLGDNMDEVPLRLAARP